MSMNNMHMGYDDLGDSNNNLRSQSQGLTHDYSKLKQIIAECLSSTNKLNSSLDPLNGKVRSLNVVFNNMINNALKAMTKEVAGGFMQGGASGGFANFGANLMSGFMKGAFGGMRASGGNVMPGMSYMVGERGPELFTPSSTGNISPNSRTTVGAPINITMNINTTDAESFQRSQSQILSALNKSMSKASRNL